MLVVTAVPALLVGCRTPDETGGGATQGAGQAGALSREHGRVYLTVDFEPGRTLRYRFISDRRIALDWDPNATAARNRVQEHAERLEMVVAYVPAEVDPYGVSTIAATVESVRTVRRGGPTGRAFGTDPVETSRGRTFTIRVDPRGRIVDASQLRALIQEMGEKAFRTSRSGVRIKEPDMIGDFVASQWFLWDAVATIPLPAAGLAMGQTWSSQLSVPTPMVMREARDVVYRLTGVRPDEHGPIAAIESTYAHAESAPPDWPIPYAGRFQVSGTFGFLSGYEVLGLDGTGEELFNIEAGRIERRQQKYTMQVKAALPPLGIRANPHITIEQTLIMELVDQNEEIRNKHMQEISNSKHEIPNKFQAQTPNAQNAAAVRREPFGVLGFGF